MRSQSCITSNERYWQNFLLSFVFSSVGIKTFVRVLTDTCTHISTVNFCVEAAQCVHYVTLGFFYKGSNFVALGL